MRLGVLFVLVIQMLLMMAGDVEPNPGPGEGGGIGGARWVRKREGRYMLLCMHDMMPQYLGSVICSFIGTEFLGPDDLCDVLEAIFTVKHKWYYIGLKLRIPHHTLDDIETNKANTTDCLTEMLKRWLSSTSPPPTWSGIIQALSSVSVGEKRLAEGIKKKYWHQVGEQATGPALGDSRVVRKPLGMVQTYLSMFEL